MPQPATLTFTVNRFKSLAGSPVQVMMTGNGPTADVNVSVSPSSGSNVTVDTNGAVTVSRNGNSPVSQPIALQVTGYSALALVFKGAGSDPSGANAFGQYVRNNGNGNNAALTVTDNDTANASWEFYVLVQNLTTGDFGLIDPKITNQ